MASEGNDLSALMVAAAKYQDSYASSGTFRTDQPWEVGRSC